MNNPTNTNQIIRFYPSDGSSSFHLPTLSDPCPKCGWEDEKYAACHPHRRSKKVLNNHHTVTASLAELLEWTQSTAICGWCVLIAVERAEEDN